MKNRLLIMAALCLWVIGAAPKPSFQKPCGGAAHLTFLKFNSEFFDEIKSGRKTATTRKGVRCVAVGDVLEAQTNEGVKKGMLTVTKVRVLRFDEIDAELAAAEDATVDELKQGLREIYGPSIEAETLTTIWFAADKAFGR